SKIFEGLHPQERKPRPVSAACEVEPPQPEWSGLRLTSAQPMWAKQLVLTILSEPTGLYKSHSCNVCVGLNAFAWTSHRPNCRSVESAACQHRWSRRYNA